MVTRREKLQRKTDTNSSIALLLSGGVDSSVALMLLKETGYKNITAYYLKIWLEEETQFLGECPWEEDLEIAEAVSEAARVPLKIIPMQKEYYERVVSYTISELKKGFTPSPDIFCNRFIKFGAFFERCHSECDYIATGHYASVVEDSGVHYLHRSPDPVKDQSYFLARMTQDQLQRAHFPLGSYTKSQVRELSRSFDLPNADRKDSQGLCFLGKIRYSEFIRCHLGEKKGDIVEKKSGKVLGEHKGYWFHTIGQRQGLGLGNGPWYVCGKDIEKNIIYVASGEAMRESASKTFVINDLNWLAAPPTKESLTTKLRHGPQLNPCTVHAIDGGKMVVTLEQDDPGIAPGQFSVLYDDTLCLGSGKIRYEHP